MAIKKTEEVKELLSKLDLPVPDGEELPDDYFEKDFGTKYIARESAKDDKELVSSIIGGRMGAAERNVRKLLGLSSETVPSDVKDIEGLVEFGVKRFTGEMEELKTKATQGNDKKVADLMAEKENWSKKEKEKDQIIQTLKEENEKIASEKTTFIKQTNITAALNEVRGKVKISDEAKKDELKMRGFESLIKEKAAFDWDEKDGLVLKDPKTGDRMLKVGGYLSAEEFLEQQAKEAGILQMTTGKGSPTPGHNPINPTPQPQPGQNNGRRQPAQRLGALGA